MPTKPETTHHQAARVAALVAIQHGASNADARAVRQQVLQELECSEMPQTAADHDTPAHPEKLHRPLQ